MKGLGKSQELVEQSKGKVRKESGKSNKIFRRKQLAKSLTYSRKSQDRIKKELGKNQ